MTNKTRNELIKLLKHYDDDNGVHYDTILGYIRINEEELDDLLIELLIEGLIYEPQIHYYKWA